MRRFAPADAVNMLLAAGALLALLLRLAERAAGLHAAAFALGALAGYACADVVSGVVHWLCDRYGHAHTRLVGPMLIAPFREHHVDPDALARHGLLERNGNNCLAALPVLALAFWSLGAVSAGNASASALSGWLCALAFTLCISNQLHAWAHDRCPPRPVRALQRVGVLIAPERHEVHHRGGRSYAIVSGWSNAWLDRLVAAAERELARRGVRTSAP